MPGLKAGDRISNYILEVQIGSGSFAEVWKARHHMFNEQVAIKIPIDSQYVRNLRQEGVTVHGLKHPNIVRAIDLDPYATPPYFVMELVDGPSLRQVLDSHPGGVGAKATVNIMRGILSGLGRAHQAGLIHRDVKPANILLRRAVADIGNVQPDDVKVTDFGMGHAGGITTASIMQSGSLLTEQGRSISGTLAYMSPEQREGQPLDARSDLYACGIILFELLTGERPQGGEMPSSLNPDVPSHLDAAFRRSYARLGNRFASADEMAQMLETRRSVVPPPPPIRDHSATPSCPRCRRTVERGDHFCIYCGQQLVETVPRCHACHAYVHRNDHYCIFCGADLRMKKV